MSKRLPRPGNPRHVRLVLDDDELAEVDRMAGECRLSVASFVRALIVGAIEDWPERMEATKAAAAKLSSDLPPGRNRPGRPPDKKGRKP